VSNVPKPEKRWVNLDGFTTDDYDLTEIMQEIPTISSVDSAYIPQAFLPTVASDNA
jgi:hypothetical protein